MKNVRLFKKKVDSVNCKTKKIRSIWESVLGDKNLFNESTIYRTNRVFIRASFSYFKKDA